MSIGEVLRLLRDEGFSVSAARIRYAMLAGHVATPAKDGAGNYSFKSKHIGQLRTYFRDPPRPGRKAANCG